MSTSYYVIGMRPPDDTYKKMKDVLDTCEKANVEIPDEVEMFFDGHKPDPKGIEVDLPTIVGNDEYREWHTVLVSDIPKNITEIRFVISG